MKEIDLDTLSKKENYPIPEGYFDQLPHQIMRTIRKERARRRNIAAASIAAVALAIICTSLIINYKIDDMQNQKDIVIEAETADKQIEDQMADYYSAELAQIDYYNY